VIDRRNRKRLIVEEVNARRNSIKIGQTGHTTETTQRDVQMFPSTWKLMSTISHEMIPNDSMTSILVLKSSHNQSHPYMQKVSAKNAAINKKRAQIKSEKYKKAIASETHPYTLLESAEHTLEADNIPPWLLQPSQDTKDSSL